MSRRVVYFLFTRPVGRPDPLIKDKILAELPSLVWRFASKYLKAVREHAGEGFWDWCHPEIKTAQDLMKSSANNICAFLALHEDHSMARVAGTDGFDTLVYTKRSSTLSTTIKALNDAFQDFMRLRGVQTRDKVDKATMEGAHRFVVKIDNFCKACNMHSSDGPCCGKYNRGERGKAMLVTGLALVTKRVPSVLDDEADELD
jgi:hypothetical protein